METPRPIRTWLCERLGLRYPIIQAPMAGGPTTPALVAAVGNAGALGSFGFAYTEAQAMRSQMQAARSLTAAPIHINLFVENAPAQPGAVEMQAALQALRPIYETLGVPPLERVEAPYAPDFAAQLEAALELQPAVLSMHFRQLTPEHIREAHARGILLAASATNLAEARHIESLAVDFVIAQGAVFPWSFCSVIGVIEAGAPLRA